MAVKILPDYACSVDESNRVLDKVGIKDVNLYAIDFNGNTVLTKQSTYVGLGHEKGTHMSRFVEILNEYAGGEISCRNEILESLLESHNANSVSWECKWKTIYDDGEHKFSMDVFLEGTGSACDEEEPSYKWYLTFKVPYASVCPCSHEMVKDAGHGVPHMQRSIAQVSIRVDSTDDLGLLMTQAIRKVVEAVDLVPEGLMKRPDELAWCERAADTNLFVEDAARAVSDAIDSMKFDDWVVVNEHMESIHEHNVVAVARKGVDLL